MKIELSVPNRMSQTGSSLLRLIQNNDMPIIDLLVRESIQNSLDAKLNSSEYVRVDFNIGTFEACTLNRELDKVSDKFNQRYPEQKYQYIAIRDSNTQGLTGPLDYEHVHNNNYGNLLKLVYEISKPQESKGAGGSWGLGKTVYYRVGNGLVIYYSRIKKSDCSYESRLAACFVEDERSEDSILPSINENKTGLAWWGAPTDKENRTVPLTDEEEIHRILQIFDISPYKEAETGTTIILPYINKESILLNNQKYLDEEENVYCPWLRDFDDHLKTVVQRWYAPRLSCNYNCNPYLKVYVNGSSCSFLDMEPPFKVMSCLYDINYIQNLDSDLNKNGCAQDKLLSYLQSNIKTKKISIRNVFKKENVGTLTYVAVPKQLLGCNPPINNPIPYVYFNMDFENDKNTPIFSYTRKPGMLVTYDDSSLLSDILLPDQSSTLFALFTLESNTEFKEKPYTVEDYVREAEKADHNSWSDHEFHGITQKVIAKIKKQIKNHLKSEYVTENKVKNSEVSSLSKSFAKLLPPYGFGNQPSKQPSKIVKSKRTTVVQKNGSKTLVLYEDKTKYSNNGLSLFVKLSCDQFLENAKVKLFINTETGAISIDEWIKSLEQDCPFEIDGIDVFYDENESNCVCSLNKQEPKKHVGNMTFILRNDELDLIQDEPSQLEFYFSVKLKIFLKNIQLQLKIVE